MRFLRGPRRQCEIQYSRFSFTFNNKMAHQMEMLSDYFGMDHGMMLSHLIIETHKDEQNLNNFRNFFNKDFLAVMNVNSGPFDNTRLFLITKEARKVLDESRGINSKASYLRGLISYYYSIKLNIISEENKNKIIKILTKAGYKINKSAVLENNFCVFIDVHDLN